jgi:hypothetical protein
MMNYELLSIVGFALATSVDVLAAFILMIGMNVDHGKQYEGFHRLGKWVLAIGLIAQAGRNIQFIHTGHSPTDAELPLWMLKDLGVFLVVFYWIKVKCKAEIK